MLNKNIQTGLLQVAERMILAATTAPKGRGVDNLEMAILERPDIEVLAAEMERLGQEHEAPVFVRDAANLREQVHIAVLIGTKVEPLGLKYCGLCGFPDCAANRAARGICAFNTGDLGIAMGSAVSVAARCHADNRVMYTLGMAALSLRLLGEEVKIAYGIPLTATGKNPFFDRK
ncbi:ferredoxin [candidate division FCPU426 bacterium]|nr:ferredoxin [candidate division FCPU426 bacterium]